MVQTEERPLKIRKLDLVIDNEQTLAPPSSVGFGENNQDDIEISINNNSTKVAPSTIKDDGTIPFVVSGCDNALENNPAELLSKNQLKKLQKKQRWEEGREYRKAKQKEKRKEKKLRKAEERATIHLQNIEDVSPMSTILPKSAATRPIQLPITFVLDCDFDNLMTEHEMISLASQLTRSYSENRHAPYQAHLIISSFGGNLKRRFETVLASNHLGWKGVNFMAEDFTAAARQADIAMRGPKGGQLAGALAGAKHAVPLPLQSSSPSTGTSGSFTMTQSGDTSLLQITGTEGNGVDVNDPASNSIASATMEQTYPSHSSSITKESGDITNSTAAREPAAHISDQGLKSSVEPSVLYLTADSPCVLDVLSPYTTYVIGGLVDKNRHKGICYKRAMERNIPTAKLPIGQYMNMQSRSVLATNHVVEIMIRWLESGDWAKAFLDVIPKRKEAKLKVKAQTSDDLQDSDNDDARSASEEDECGNQG